MRHRFRWALWAWIATPFLCFAVLYVVRSLDLIHGMWLALSLGLISMLWKGTAIALVVVWLLGWSRDRGTDVVNGS